MRKIYHYSVPVLLFFLSFQLMAQRTITGTVSDETGPLPDVNIVIKGTQKGTQTDFDGNYTIQANTGDQLVFSYVGLQTKTVTVGQSNKIDVLMKSEANVLEAVVITAQGIKKEKKALGYSVSTVKDKAIKDKPEADLTRVLSGKTSGVNIIAQNGLVGSSNKIVIRTMNSFTGDNNALYVIDGVPVSNDTNAAGNFITGNMGSSRSFDIDPNNIESIQILKGLAAATLYGTDGRNGVVLITTKTGSKKNMKSKQEIQVSTSIYFSNIASLPDYQNTFGGGFDQAFGWYYSNWGPGFYRDGLGGWGQFSGPQQPYDDEGTLAHPYSTSAYLATYYPDYKNLYAGKRYKWQPYNGVEEFFRTGISTNSSINIKGRSKDNDFTYGMTFSHLNEDGFTPGNNVKRSNLSVAGSAKLTNKINVSSTLNYSHTNFNTPPVALSFGSSSPYPSIFGDIFYTPRSIDLMGLPFELPDGSSIYYRDNNSIQHPLWTVKNAQFNQLTNRVYGNVSFNFKVNENNSLTYRASVDTYSEDNTNYQNKGGISFSRQVQTGYLKQWNNRNTIWYHTALLNGQYKLDSEEKFSMDYTLGSSLQGTNYNRLGYEAYNQTSYGLLTDNNFSEKYTIGYKESRNILGVFAQINLDYDNMLFLNLSGRNDWVSNIKNNSMFYPSASISFIPTKAFQKIKSKWGINYLKLRAGYGTSANFPTGYPLARNATINTHLWINDQGETLIGNSTSYYRNNPDIKPELFSELEYGLEGKFIDHRLNVDFSYFTRQTHDMIVDQPIPSSSGYNYILNNIGEITAWGIEADVNFDVFKNKEGFNWNTGVNFTQNRTEVTELSPDTDFIMYAGFTNLGNGARVGYPLGAIFGSRIKRDENGNLLVNDSGFYISEDADEEGLLPFIGDPNPDYVMNFNNTFSYKNFSFNFIINHTAGGDIYSTTIASLLGRGLTTDTVDRLGTYIVPGVNENTGEPNTVQINNSDFYFGNIFAGPAEELTIFDASVVRLQEVSLSYTFPKKLIEHTPFGKVSIQASGYNLWYNAYNTPEGINFDPNINALGATNGQGFDYLTGPSGKKYGFSINATF